MEGYLSKDEVRPIRNLFDIMICRVSEEVNKYGVSFFYRLVGSAKRNLVICHPTKGVDCDYQIVLQKYDDDMSPGDIKRIFKKSFDKHLPYGCSPCEDSTSALTIKKIDTLNSRISFSYDIVILRVNEGIPEIIRRTHDNIYVWNQLKNLADFHARYSLIVGPAMWEELKARYLKKKIRQMNGDDSKKSFQLLNEAVNETLQVFGQ